MSDQPFEVREKPGKESWDKRWILVDPVTDKVLDDAQGYGYKSKQSAIKAGWYKFGGGKRQLDTAAKDADRFWRNHKEFGQKIQALEETWFKEIARGEINLEQEVQTMAEALGIEGFHKWFLAHLK